MTLMPDQRLRRSALYRELKALDATFAEVNGAAVRLRSGEDLGILPIADFAARLAAEVAAKS